MRFQPYILFSICLCLILGMGQSTYGQKFNFRYYNEYDGIPSKFAYSIEQDDHGYLLVGNDEGVFRFDGFIFEKVAFKDSISDEFVRCSLKDSRGQIWFGHNKGGISIYDGEELRSIDLKGLNTSRINDICQSADGSIWAVTQSSGLIRISDDRKAENFDQGIEEFYSYCIAAYGSGFLLGTDMGLVNINLKDDSSFDVVYIDKIPDTRITSIVKKEKSYLISTEDKGAYEMILDEQNFVVQELLTPDLNLRDLFINDIYEDTKGDVWISTNGTGLYQLCKSKSGICEKVIQFNEGGLDKIKSINRSIKDREGNLWIASNDGGLVKLVNSYFSYYKLGDISEVQMALSILPLNDEDLWIGTEEKVLRCGILPWKVKESYGESKGLPNSKYISMCKGDDGRIWTGNSNGQLFYKNSDEDKFREFELIKNARGKNINHLAFDGKRLVASTSIGVFIIEDMKISQILTMGEGLPHDWVNMAVFDDQNNIWFATQSKYLSYLPFGSDKVLWEIDQVMNSSNNSSLLIDSKQNFWVGTKGSGLYQNENDSLVNFNVENSNIFKNYVNSTFLDVKNQIWISHRGGLSRFDPVNLSIKRFDDIEGEHLNFSDNSIAQDKNDNVWFGTDDGVLRYAPEMESKIEVAPILNLNDLIINDTQYEADQFIELPFKSDYRIKINYLGLSFKDSQSVQYSYRLLGSDENWSEPTTNSDVPFNRLVPGQYTFEVRTVNSEGLPNSEVKSVQFSIDKPFYWKWWFYLLVASVLFVVVRYIVIRRERFLKRNQEYLTNELDERTKEVVEQKEILERTNQDITDSIEYAKKIQTAILPPPNSLNEYFSSSFVFYKPRDIVSGDFYWVREMGEYVILACADCTGHGVPGAFMSLIGSSLLREISSKKEIQKPSHAIQRMDDEINKLLNRKDSRFGVSDGMDMTVVEYNKATNFMRISSAKRPFVLIKDGEQQTFSGDRFSVGGFQDDVVKEFTDHEFQLKKGDRFYLYSDGYVDQFGGDRGKKLKHKGFLETIAELQSTQLSEQRNLMKKKFTSWINGYEQIDDVIVIGVEV